MRSLVSDTMEKVDPKAPTKKLYRHRCMGYIGWKHDIVPPHYFISYRPAFKDSDGLCPDCLKKYLNEIKSLDPNFES